MIINLLAATNNGSIEENIWLISLGIILLIAFVYCYSKVVYNKAPKSIEKTFAIASILFLVSTIICIIKPLENPELLKLLIAAIIVFLLEWFWERFYFSKFWSGKRTKKMMVYRNMFAIIGLILIALHVYIFVMAFTIESIAAVVFVLTYTMINLIIFLSHRDLEEHCYY